MATTNFIDRSTVIVATWLNDVNAATYTGAGTLVTADDNATSFNNVAVDLLTKVPHTSTTGSATLPSGTTAQRDGVPIDGMIRYNSTLLQFEGYFNGNWQSVGGGQLLGNATTKGIFYNAQTISENLTVDTGTNAMSAGPITIANGFTVTINSGSVWSII